MSSSPRTVVIALVVGTLFLAPLGAPLVAAPAPVPLREAAVALPRPTELLRSAWDTPLDPAERGAFVDEWAARILDETSAKALLAGDVPDAAAWTPEERMALARALAEDLVGPDDPALRMKTLVLYGLLFDREGLAAEMQGPAPPTELGAPTPQEPEAQAAPGMPDAPGYDFASLEARLAEAVADIHAGAPAAAADANEALRPLPPVTGPSRPAAVLPLPDPPLPAGEPAEPGVDIVNLPPPLDALPSALPYLPGAGVAMYRACGQAEAQPVVCSVPVPLGTPVALDVDGTVGFDLLVHLAPLLLPDAIGAPGSDPAELLEAPDKLSTAAQENVKTLLGGGAAVTLRIQTLLDATQLTSGGLPCDLDLDVGPAPPYWHAEYDCILRLPSGENNIVTPFQEGLAAATGPRNLTARAWAEYEVPTAPPESMGLRLGVDGLGSKIPEVSTIAFRIHSLATLFAGRLLGDLNVTFDDPGDDVALFGQVSDVDEDGVSYNPTTFALHMTPVPDLHADVDVLVDGTHAIVDLTVTEPTLATISYEDDQTVPAANYTKAVVVADQLPERVYVEYLDLADGTQLFYNASSTIALLTASYVHDDALWHLEGSASIQQLPASILVELHTDDDEEGVIHYEASSVVPQAEVAFSALNKTGGVTALGEATVRDIPAQFDITYDARSDPEILLYEASSELGPVDLAYYTLPKGLAIEAHVESLPRVVELRTGEDFTRLDTRSAPGQPEASGAIGLVDLRFSTDGTFLPNEPDDTHVVALQFPVPGPQGNTTRVDLRYDGLKFALADMRNEEMHLDVRNAQDRHLRFDVDLPKAHAKGFVHEVPDRITLDNVDTVFTYRAYGDVIDQVHLEFDNKSVPVPMLLTVDAYDVPDEIVLDLDLDQHRIVYDASTEVTQVTGFGQVPTPLDGTFELQFNVEGIPAHFEVNFTKGALRFDAPGGLGHIAVMAHNVPPVWPDPACGYDTGTNHMCATIREVAKETTLSFELDEVKEMAFLQNELPDGSSTNDIALEAEAPENFLLSLLIEPAPEVLFPQERITVFGTMNPLPSEVALSTGDRITYEGSDPFTLDLTAEFGPVANLGAIGAPAAPAQGVGIHIHGEDHSLAEWDDIQVVKTRTVLTGVGTFVEVNTKDTGFTMRDWQPTLPDLTFDMLIHDDPTTADEDESITVEVTVHSAAPDGNQDLSGAFANGPDDGLQESETSVAFTFEDPIEPADPAVPAVEAVITLGDTRVAFDVRNLPTSLAFTIHSLGSLEAEGGGIRVTYDADGAVKRVDMGLDILAEGGEANGFDPPNDFMGAFTLQEIPTDFVFSIIKNAAGNVITYEATDPHGIKDPSDLDVDLAIDKGELHVILHAVDMGASFSLTPVPGEPDTREVPNPDDPECDTIEEAYVPTDNMAFHSAPKTTSVAVTLSDEMSSSIEGWGGRWCFSLGPINFRFQWGFTVQIDILTQNLKLEVTGLGDTTITTGFINHVEGDYGSFRMEWGDSGGQLDLTIGATVKACWEDDCIDPFGLFPGVTPGDVDLSNLRFYRAKASPGDFMVPITFDGPCIPVVPPAGIELDLIMTLPIALEPHPEGSQDNYVTADGGSWYFLPSPFVAGTPIIPDWVAYIILWIGSDSEDKGVSFSFPGIPIPVPSPCSLI